LRYDEFGFSNALKVFPVGLVMAELAHTTEQEFWRPPIQRDGDDVVPRESSPSMAEACPRCRTEFLMGSSFCHTCGIRRPVVLTQAEREDAVAIASLWQSGVVRVRSLVSAIPWRKFRLPSWLRHLDFHEIKSRTGLSTGSLIAFVLGLACIAGALLVGLLTARTLVDWQAIQFYRVEWLLAATASFVAGILLKKPSRD